MMRNAVWVGLGWMGFTLISGASARLAPGYVAPDLAVVVVAFLALRREPIPLAVCALTLGYLVGRQAVAPVGVHETALLLTAVGVYLIAGHLAGSGSLFFAFICGGAVMGYHVILFGMITMVQGRAGFASTTTALLLPTAFTTALFALVLNRPMQALESKLSPQRREGLAWH